MYFLQSVVLLLGLVSLNWLSLAFNRMPNVSENTFEPLLHLTSLYLDYNQLHHLHNKSLQALQGTAQHTCIGKKIFLKSILIFSSNDLFSLDFKHCVYSVLHLQFC